MLIWPGDHPRDTREIAPTVLFLVAEPVSLVAVTSPSPRHTLPITGNDAAEIAIDCDMMITEGLSTSIGQ